MVDTRGKIVLAVVIVIFVIGLFGSLLVAFSGVSSEGSNFFSLFGRGKVAVIDVKGEIVPSTGFLTGGVSPDSILPLLDEVESGNYVGALIKIDSPGGTVVTSKSIAQAVKDMNKPTVCLLGDIAASGAYWIASSCDYIVSDSLSLTGSIGVTASYLEYTGFMEKYGIKYEQFTSGENKEVGSPFSNLSEENRDKMQKLVDDTFKYFLDDVVASRGLTEEQIEAVKQADIFIGRDALELNLVDELGGIKEAKIALERLTGLKNLEYVELGSSGGLGFF